MNRKTIRSLLCVVVIAAMLLSSVSVWAAAAAVGDRSHLTACRSYVGPLLTLSEVAETAAGRRQGPRRAPALDPVVSDLPLAVIVIGFSDQAYRSDLDWAQKVFRDEMSLAQYYLDMSFGQFTFTPVQENSAYGVNGNTNEQDAPNDGVIHVTLSVPHDDWTLEYSSMSAMDKQTNLSLQQALIAAVEAADAAVDFSAYDVNADGEITTNELAVAFVVAGYEASSSDFYEHGKSLYLWSHAYSFRDAKKRYSFTHALPQPDSVTVDSYIAISELEDDDTQEPISTLAHELGHYLGLPDLYDTLYSTTKEWSKYEVLYLSLMDYGIYGTDPVTGERIPCSLDPWSRVILGWVEPETAGETGVYSLTKQNYTDDADYSLLRIDTPHSGEYYLLENRSFLKWDAGLADAFGREDGGIVLWHIDDAMWDKYHTKNTINNSDHRPAVMPLYAESTGGVYSFIGSNTKVDLNTPFFDKTGWETRFSSLGTTLDLPLYGTGSNANLRTGRTLSGIKLAFLSDPGDTMRVRLNPDDHVHDPVYTVVTAPACTEPGAAYYVCTVCGACFADETGENEITEPFAVDALGHAFGAWTLAKPFSVGTSCTMTRICVRCGEPETCADAALSDAFVLEGADVRVGSRAGRQVHVPVYVRSDPGVTDALLHVEYDRTQLRLTDVVDGGYFGSGAAVSGDDLSAVPYTVSWSGNASGSTDASLLVTLTFEVLQDAGSGVLPITLTCGENNTTGAGLTDIPAYTADGSVELVACVSGDASGDGIVNLRDTVLIVRFLAQDWNVQIHEINADANGDGYVDLKDLVLLRRYLAGGWNVTLR